MQPILCKDNIRCEQKSSTSILFKLKLWRICRAIGIEAVRRRPWLRSRLDRLSESSAKLV